MGSEFAGSALRGQIVVEILRYLLGHPEAKDTAAGIGKWWKEADAPEWSPEEVEGALQWLVFRHWVLVRQTARGKLFGANPDQIEEIRRFLSGIAQSVNRREE